MHRLFISPKNPACGLILLLTALGAAPAIGQGAATLQDLEPLILPALDAEQILLADERRAAANQVPHYAARIDVGIDPFGAAGTWDLVPSADGTTEAARWRLRVASPGALSLNLAFTRFQMPPGGRLELISTDGRHRVGPWTTADNEDHGQLWTPPVPTDDLVLDLRLPIDEVEGLELELTWVHHGYAGFGEPEPRSGACHRDIACSEAEPWIDQARSVALISVAGRSFCTGFLVNNTALDGRPFLLTAEHCGVTPRNAPSVVVLWNHQRRDCGDPVGGDTDPGTDGLSDFQNGAVWRAAHRATDTLLLELDDPPAADGVFYAGWDRSPVNPERSTVIHHPNADHKSISFDFDRATTTRHLDSEPRDPGTHIRIADWDMGSTEGGSSGAPLFNEDGRAVGLLQGGYAACGAPRSDWFGRFSAAWDGDRPRARLRDWLDPLATGATTLDGLDGATLETR